LAAAARPAPLATALRNGPLVPIVIYGAFSKDNNVLNNASPSAAPEPSPAVTLAGLTLLTGLVLRRAIRRTRTARA